MEVRTTWQNVSRDDGVGEEVVFIVEEPEVKQERRKPARNKKPTQTYMRLTLSKKNIKISDISNDTAR